VATKTTPQVTEAVQMYLAEYEYGWSKRTHQTYAALLNRFARSVPDMQVGRLTTDHYKRFLITTHKSNARGKQSSATTINQYRAVLRGFISFCHRKGWNRGDLLDHVGKVKAEVRRDFIRLSPDELMQMLRDAEHPRDRALLAGGMNTALRASELRSIRLKNLDLDKGEFYAVIHKSTMSDVFPISADLDAEWRMWLAWYAANIDGPLQGDYYLLPAKDGRRMTGKAEGGKTATFRDGVLRPAQPIHHAERIVQAGLRKLGYTNLAHEGIHTLRRSVGRIYFDSIREEGYDYALRETMAFLHHKNTHTTEIYLGLDVERAKRDTRLRGKPFLSGMVAAPASVSRINQGGV
jgi:integrase